MARWIAKAKNALGQGAAREPQTYEVTCGCGQTVYGERDPQHQEIECDGCGELLFVLPADAYPLLNRPKKRRRKRPRRPTTPPVSTPSVSKPPVSAPPVSDPLSEAAIIPEKVELPTASLPKPRRRKSSVTSFRIVMLAMVTIVSVTTYWALHLRSLDRAAVTARKERDAANAALGERDFAVAATHFQRACEALEVLGRDDALARSTCQLARETTAASHLANDPLLTIVEHAHTKLSAARTNADRKEVAEHVLDLYAGGWIVIDTTLIPDAGEADAGEWTIDFPFTIGKTEVLIDAGLPIFQPRRPGEDFRRVIFAAQIDGCRFTRKPRPVLELDLNNETAFLWTNYDILRELGMAGEEADADGSLRAVLSRQAQSAGVTR